ncbi:uncharacterized protein TM35_000242050 [Trypanosoma theileri]|uniref:CS domain-containing protein n=1 Tax=Trypanosoma theileri TaxID=67003 RepID=A0A1X0NQQ8_9TRYP|nr:uncharacterized protein TM35_000242050 [Trypanosoma theileri]ORC87055.1 hypothetical protein TM35_000242050 [Trypanosoma theileri]
MSEDYSVGKSRWSQGDDGDESLEIRIPIVLPQSARAKELTVEVKDLAILCVRHRETVILQWRLYEPVAREVEWRVEDEGSLLVLDLAKKSPSVWPCLLDLPMQQNDELFLSHAELDVLFREHLPSMPESTKEDQSNTNDANTQQTKEGADLDNEEDLDKLLEEAAEEVVGTPSKRNDNEFIQAELENYKAEETEIQKKLLETQTALESNVDGEGAKEAQKQKEILEEILRLHNLIREKRTLPSTLDGFLEITQLEIRKARACVSELEDEKETFASEEERAMEAHELMAKGLKHFGEQDIQSALHFLRLAAIHHNHEQSTLILYNIYTELGSPRGAFLLLKLALKGDSISAAANLKVGEQFDTGARHFLPLFPAAMYFYQRAAQAGNVHAMLAIAQLYLRGSTSSTMLTTEQMEGLKSVEKYHSWIERAIDRGCGSAYFVKGCMYLEGEHGCRKSYQIAKDYLEKATSSQPGIKRRAAHVYVLLERLRQEEEGVSEPKIVASPLTLAKAKQANTYNDNVDTKDDDGNGAVQVSASMDRLSKISSKGVAPDAGVMRSKKMANHSSNTRVFWEKAVTTGVSLYSLYTITFPLRVMLLPYFYTFIGPIVERIPWLSAAPPPMQF